MILSACLDNWLVFTNLTDLTKALIFYCMLVMLAIAITFVPLDGVVTRDGHAAAGWAALGLHRLGLKGWPLVWATGIATYKDAGRIALPRAAS